jgi:hypothetical protein
MTSHNFLRVHLCEAWNIGCSYRDVFTYQCLVGAFLGPAWLSPDFPMLTREQGA